jgi:hypothetical protein
MNKYVKLIVAVLVIAGYGLILRYIAPSREPYFILGIGVIGYVAWLFGMTAGVATILLLTPLTLLIYKQFDVAISYSAFAYAPPFIALECFIALFMGRLHGKVKRLSRDEASLREINDVLQGSLAQVREVGGILSLCSSCKSIMDDDGTWTKIDSYLKNKTKAEFSHGICPDCAEEYVNPTGQLRDSEVQPIPRRKSG